MNVLSWCVCMCCDSDWVVNGLPIKQINFNGHILCVRAVIVDVLKIKRRRTQCDASKIDISTNTTIIIIAIRLSDAYKNGIYTFFHWTWHTIRICDSRTLYHLINEFFEYHGMGVWVCSKRIKHGKCLCELSLHKQRRRQRQQQKKKKLREINWILCESCIVTNGTMYSHGKNTARIRAKGARWPTKSTAFFRCAGKIENIFSSNCPFLRPYIFYSKKQTMITRTPWPFYDILFLFFSSLYFLYLIRLNTFNNTQHRLHESALP